MNEASEKSTFMMYFNGCLKFNGKGFDMMIPRVYTYALKYGLEDQDMITIIKIAFENRLSFLRMKKFMRCLIPRIYVSNEVTELVIQYLFRRFAENEVPLILNYLIHWLTGILQYKLILTKQCIYNHYDKFYNLFSCEPITVATCKLIYLLTSPEDVKLKYANKLVQLHSIYTLKDKNHFGVLLRLFKCYKPNIVSESIAYYSVNKNLGTLSTGINHSLLSATTRIRNNYKILRGLNALLWDKKLYQHIVLKRKEVALIPRIVGNPITNRDIKNLVLSEVVISTLYKFDSSPPIEPTSVLSLLKNFKQRVLVALGDEIIQIRLCIELVVIFKDAFFLRKNMISYKVRETLLTKVAIFQNEIHQAVPTVTEFLENYLKTWDGIEHQNLMLNLFEWLHIKSFSYLYETILSKIKMIFLECSLSSKCMFLFSIAGFIVNTMHFQANEANGLKPLFLKEKISLDFSLLCKDLLKFMQNICINAIIKEEGHPLVMNSIKYVHQKIFAAGKKVVIKSLPANYIIEYWPAFESDYKMLFRIGEIQQIAK